MSALSFVYARVRYILDSYAGYYLLKLTAAIKRKPHEAYRYSA